MRFLNRFVDSNDREIRRLQPLVDATNALEAEIEALSDDEIRANFAEDRDGQRVRPSRAVVADDRERRQRRGDDRDRPERDRLRQREDVRGRDREDQWQQHARSGEEGCDRSAQVTVCRGIAG